MKTFFSPMISIVVLSLAMLQSANAEGGDDEHQDQPPDIQRYLSVGDSARQLVQVLVSNPAPPRGPQEVLGDYETEMAGIAQRMSGELRAISQRVACGQLSRERAEYLSSQRYQVAMMQFELLSTWHEILERAIAGASTLPSSRPAVAETVVVPLPFSSLQLDPELARHLQLTEEQNNAIQRLMDQQRQEIAPLMAKFEAVRQQLGTERQRRNPDEPKIRSLAETQAHLLSELIAENAQLQTKISLLLSPEQRKKLEELKQRNIAAALASQ